MTHHSEQLPECVYDSPEGEFFGRIPLCGDSSQTVSLEEQDTKDDRNEGAEVLSSSIQIPYAGRGMTLRNVDSEPAANVPESGIGNKLNLNANDGE